MLVSNKGSKNCKVKKSENRYRRGQEFKSRAGLNFFQAFFSLLLKWCSLLRRSLSYSRLYPQCKYMTFIYSQPLSTELIT